MFIHTIAPVSNIPRESMLTYFSKGEISPGTLVEVLYGKNKILGIVHESEPLKNVKELVRNQDFQLRKIHRIINGEKIDKAYIEKIQSWSREHFIPSGKILTDIFPKWFWKGKFAMHLSHQSSSLQKRGGYTLVETDFTDRLAQYKKEILAKDKIWICVPNVYALKKIHSIIKEDPSYAGYTVYLFHSTVTEKKQIQSYTDIHAQKKCIILSTPYYFGLFSTNVDVIIYEQYGTDGYTIGQTYDYDITELAKNIPAAADTTIYGGTLIPIPLSVPISKGKRILDYTGFTKENTRHSQLFVNEHIARQFDADILAGKKILLVTQYKDNNIKIVCNDCKQLVVCPTCQLALHSLVKKDKTYFHCRFCKKSYPSKTTCKNCQSWNLTALGINTKTIKEFIESYPIPSDEGVRNITITSLSDAEKYMPKSFDSVYVISIDGLMHNPHFKTEERILRTLLTIQDIGDKLYVQTSFPFPNILSTLKNISLSDWKKQETIYRQKNHYPPYGTIYTITARTRRDQIMLDAIQKSCMEHTIASIDSPYRLTIFVPTTHSTSIETILDPYRQSQIIIKKETS